MNLFWSLLLLFMVSLSTSIASEKCPLKGKSLTLGYDDWPPYQFKTKKKVSGLDVDLIRAILEKGVGCSLKLKSIGWKPHLTQLKKGKIHLAGGASKNKEREIYATFSDPYRTESAVMIINKKDVGKYSASNLKDLKKIKGFRLGINRGNWYGDRFDELKKKDKSFQKMLKETSKEGQLYKMLRKGRLNAILADRYSGAAFIKKLKLGDTLSVHPLKVYSDDIFVMFSKYRYENGSKKSVDSKDRENFIKAFNQSLKKLKASGSYQKILDKYLK